MNSMVICLDYLLLSNDFDLNYRILYEEISLVKSA